jgi:CheY-like chemotaxis protein
MKVLLVDDEEKFALMLAKRLELRGIDTAVYFSGEKALETIDQGKRFDVAILDVKMPGIGGIELKRRLGLWDPQLKFVFLTRFADGQDQSIARVRQSGFFWQGHCLDLPRAEKCHGNHLRNIRIARRPVRFGINRKAHRARYAQELHQQYR